MKTEHRVFTPRQVAEIRDGGTRIAPGIWADRAGDIHFSIPELLGLFGWPDDAAHRRLALEAIRDVVDREYPNTTVVQVETES